ncbi:MAG: hypothetical protein JWP63_5031 [Candidatus Solibacter sp.]|nr:hypothetical protein [Candidatus Solibacter sp.]
MSASRIIAVYLAFAALAGAQSSGLPPGILLLARVKAHTRQELDRLPNCSCLETIRREIKPPGGKLRPLDTIRLEVLFSEGKEMYAPPGDRRFTAAHPVAFAGGGMIGDGYFALYLKDIAGEGRVSYEYKGEDESLGRRLARYDYRLPATMSGQIVNMVEGRGIVGAIGTFWADPITYDIVRMEMHASEIPPQLPLAENSHWVDYARTKLGEDEFLIPRAAHTRMVKMNGEESINDMEFTECHLFSAESAITFGMQEQRPQFATSLVKEIEAKPLPVLDITTRLTTAITSKTSVGSLITATVSGNVPRNGAVLIPDGATVRGLVRRLEFNAEKGGYYIVGVEFTDIEAGSLRYRFSADLKTLEPVPGVDFTLVIDTTQNKQVAGSTEILSLPDLPGVGVFFVRGPKLDLPKGFRMTWKTRPLVP